MKRAFAFVFLLLGCESEVTIHGHVTIPAGVMREVSGQHPAQLLVRARAANGWEAWSGPVVFCTASEVDRAVFMNAVQFGCAPEGTAEVSIWLVESSAPVDCNLESHGPRYPLLINYTPAEVATSAGSCKGAGIACEPRADEIVASADKKVLIHGTWVCGGDISFATSLPPVDAPPSSAGK